MAKYSKTLINEFRESSKKSAFFKKQWITNEDETMSLEDYASLIDPSFKLINKDENPVIIAKDKKNGSIFYKLLIFLAGDQEVEYELSYEMDPNSIEEGDELDVNSLQFCIERWLNEKHLYVKGEIV